MSLLLRFLVNGAAIWVAAQLLSGFSYGDEWGTLALAAVALTIVNWLVKPIVTILAIPAVILTLGVALFFVNLAMLGLAAALVPDWTIGSLGTAILATVVIWAVNLALSSFTKR